MHYAIEYIKRKRKCFLSQNVVIWIITIVLMTNMTRVSVRQQVLSRGLVKFILLTTHSKYDTIDYFIAAYTICTDDFNFTTGTADRFIFKQKTSA